MSRTLASEGAKLFPRVLSEQAMKPLERLLPTDSAAGTRIFDNPTLAEWLVKGPVLPMVRAVLGESAKPVRAIVFNKTADANWALSWHQDRTIAVRQRIETPEFSHWTTKAGLTHSEPPFDIIERMLTVRIHLDAVPTEKGPLLIAPGSHRYGRILEQDVKRVVEECGSFACLAEAGDVWLYRTAILHASGRSQSGESRRVLHVDFAAEELPNGLEWLGVG